MYSHDFIKNNIGVRVYLNSNGDLAINQSLRRFIKTANNSNPDCLWIKKLTKSGMAMLRDRDDNFFSVPPRNVVEAIYRPNIETTGYATIGDDSFIFIKAYNGWENLHNITEINAYGVSNKQYIEKVDSCVNSPYKILKIKYCEHGVMNYLELNPNKEEPELLVKVEHIYETDCLTCWSYEKI